MGTLLLRCIDCGYSREVTVSDRDATFAETRAALMAKSGSCEHCGSDNVYLWSHSFPRLSRSILVEWSQDESLNLGPVEEDIVLGIHASVTDLIWLLEQPGILTRKKWDLIVALCDLLLVSLEEQDDKHLSEFGRSQHARIVKLTRNALTKHRALALEAHNAEDYCLGLNFDEIILPMLEGGAEHR